ncbi:MAG: hypothetical protein U9Q83_11260 [Bacteroidota bacterium]|nr:hypothetical protein [Bacteroidota bacterium]
MKIKHLFTFGLIALLFFSCNPNKAIYEELDAAREPYNETFSYTLTDADYTTIESLALKNAENEEDSSLANDLGTFNSFSSTRKAALMVPAFLEASFIALDSSSAISVVHNYSNKYTLSSPQIPGSFATYEDVAAAIPTEGYEEGDLLYPEFTYTGKKAIEKALFEFDGTSWTLPYDVYQFEDADFESMGIDSNSNGIYKFSDSYPPEEYLPTFFSLKNPYASSEDIVKIVYLYDIYRVSDYYTFDGDKWNNIEQKSEQFVHVGTAWKFDPTVKYEMNNSDFQLIVDWVAAQDSISNYRDETYDNTEYYFGASSHYGNFDMRDYKRVDNDPNGYLDGLSDDEVMDELYSRLPLAINIFLQAKYPDAEPFVNGVAVYYEITFDTYEPPHQDFMIKLQCTGVGTFEYVEGPTLVE